MWSFILRRGAYSLFVLLGVILLTFILFRLAAGDPAAAVLGKNPTAEEVEDLRRQLGADLPLFYGHLRRTEAYTNVDCSAERLLPGASLAGEGAEFSHGALVLKNCQLELTRNFDIEEPLYCQLAASGTVVWNGEVHDFGKGMTKMIPIPPEQQSLVVSCDAVIQDISFYFEQSNPWNSQFVNAMREICSFTGEFPYVSFFNFGRTLTTREPIRGILWRGMWPSLFLMLPIFVGELFLGIVLALAATAAKDTWIDKGVLLLSISGMSISYLVLILFGQWLLGYYYNFFPVWGWGSWQNLMLPVIVGIVSGLGGGVRFYRTVFVNELNREYLRTATAKGCSPCVVYGRHLLRNAAIPIITRATSVLPFLFTGSLLLETFFGIPGLGYAGIDALNNSDLQLLKALVIVSALLFVVINLIADIAYAWADPRIRLK